MLKDFQKYNAGREKSNSQKQTEKEVSNYESDWAADLIQIVQDVSEDVDPEMLMAIGFRLHDGQIVQAEQGSLLSSMVKLLTKMKSVKSKHEKTWSEKDRKDINKRLNSFKVKVGRKVGHLFTKGEDWPTTVLMALLYSNQTADKVLSSLPQKDVNGYHRFGHLTGHSVNNFTDVITAIRKNLVLGNIPEDIVDDFLAVLWTKFTGK